MTDVLWELNGVTLRSDSGNRLDNLSLRIRTGVTAVIGYSGAGKTSLLNLLAGMESADTGAVSFSPQQIPGRTTSLPLFWVPQDGGLWPHLSVTQHLAYVSPSGAEPPTATGRGSGGEDRSEGSQPAAAPGNPSHPTNNFLELFDLQHRRQALPGELSKGEQSRLAVARCLAANAAVMLMDEPLAHVDLVRTPKYWRIMRDFVTSSGASFVFSTHEPDVAVRESEHVICLSEGRVIYSGATAELYAQPPNREAGALLGPVNWFNPEELPIWLPQQTSPGQPMSLRPESLQIRPSENSELRILSFHFSGSYAETTLEHLPSATQKTIIHRPPGDVHFPGQSVRIDV